MIAAKPSAFSGLARALSDKAARLARAYAESHLHERRGDAQRWRRADLLWPLFTEDR